MSELPKLVRNKVFITLGSLVIILLLVVEGRQFNQKSTVQKEIDDLNAQAQSLSQKNQDLSNLITYLKTDDYKQKAARQQLNLQKDGEQVYSFSQNNVNVQTGDNNGPVADSAAVSNPKKWWNYFFKN